MLLPDEHEYWMRRCLELAALGLGSTAPNPTVGAVLVHGGRLIGQGWHRRCGEAHAEVNAVADVPAALRHLIPEATLYVSLEPCFHYGRTPPCVDLVLRERIPRVVVACTDPFEAVAGRSIAKLRAAGVEVTEGVLEAEGRHLIRRFLSVVERHRPYVILKWAQSADGYLGQRNRQVWLSNRLSRRLVHRWRTEEAAILVGANTAVTDNPQLTARQYPGRSPLRVLLDPHGRVPHGSHLFDTTQAATLVFTDARSPMPPPANGPALDYEAIDFAGEVPAQVLARLYARKVQSVIVEGGPATLGGFIAAGLWDEARVCTTSAVLDEGLPLPVPLRGRIARSVHLQTDRWDYWYPALVN